MLSPSILFSPRQTVATSRWILQFRCGSSTVRLLSSTTSSTADGTGTHERIVARMKRLKQNLEFAIEGARNVKASANLAFLERDPTERGPRAQFERDAAVRIHEHIQSAVRDAKHFIENDDHVRVCLHAELNEVLSLYSALKSAGVAVKGMEGRIIRAQETFEKIKKSGEHPVP